MSNRILKGSTVCAIKVAGIPALALIREYTPAYEPRLQQGSPWSYQTIDHPEPAYLDYVICDRKGYEADWLSHKADMLNLWNDIDKQIINCFNKQMSYEF